MGGDGGRLMGANINGLGQWETNGVKYSWFRGNGRVMG